MIKLTNILKENVEDGYVYHITPKKNLPSIMKYGLIPKPEKPARFCRAEVYLFDNRTTMEDAVMNWLGDKFPENEKLVCLTISKQGLNLHDNQVGYEFVSFKTIPPQNIVKVEDI